MLATLAGRGALAAKVTLDTPMERDEIAAMRRSYGENGIGDLGADPFAAFALWLKEASANPYIVEANAMVLSTHGDENAITTRSVLLKDVSDGGFTFYTNYQSRKAHGIEINPYVTLLFPWYAMERQVSIGGLTEKVDEKTSDEYFATRPWTSQIGAWASSQSHPLSSREELETRWQGAAQKWLEGSTVPRPPHWGGYRVTPLSIEFWQGRYSRLHDRIRYERPDIQSDWSSTRYYP